MISKETFDGGFALTLRTTWFTSILPIIFLLRRAGGRPGRMPHLHLSTASPFWKARQPHSVSAHQQTLALHQGGCKDPSQKRVTQTYHHPLPSWLGTRTLYVGTSFIWDPNYCTNIDYHLKRAVQTDGCLRITVMIVTYKKSHFLERYGVNPQSSWTMGTRPSFWKEAIVSAG